MDQYLSIKADYKDVLLLYRMGDFYETFYDDAKLLSRTIGIALTKRAHGKSADVPLAGFPHHALDNYLPKLLNAGLRVAICEQVEDPKLAKGVVKREVVEIASPGATLSEKILDSRSHNFLIALHPEGDVCGMAIADVSTGKFQLAEFPAANLLQYLQRYQPKEILVAKNQYESLSSIVRHQVNAILTRRDDWIFSREYAYGLLTTHFNTHSLKGFGCDEMDQGVTAAGVLIHYLQENYKTRLEHVVRLQVINLSSFMVLDESTRRNLEIAHSISGTGNEHTLLTVLDHTITPMGARLFKLWLQQPLVVKQVIEERLQIVSALVDQNTLRDELGGQLKGMFDMERLLGRIVTGRANGRDLNNLKLSLEVLTPLKKSLDQSTRDEMKQLGQKLDPLIPLTEEIGRAIVENPPLTIQEGHLIRAGFDPELDELRSLADDGKDWLLRYQETERQRTAITSLKVSYNRVFGYYLEVSNVHKDKVPPEYIRKQTLVNAERYITPELKEWEEKILGAEDKINAIEYRIFQEIRQRVAKYIDTIQQNSTRVAELDCYLSLATAAVLNDYVRPKVTDSTKLNIVGGRHPVVEKNLAHGQDFISNDTHLDTDEEQIWIITGPNMSGKSTFLRQTGLIVLLAQIGSYVPAQSAEVGIVDRIFTRVGASDNLALGESTFLVEMNETANILNNATNRSLILLDEIGRGTSTFDGLSIAWAVAEYLHQEKKLRSKTLFATHYHELTELALLYPRIKNYNVAVEEWNDQVVFLRKIVAGGTDNSYGIHVAEMAGLPATLIERAREILANLESNELRPNSGKPRLAERTTGRNVDKNQLNLFPDLESKKVKDALRQIDINQLTPLEALQKLDELKKIMRSAEKNTKK